MDCEAIAELERAGVDTTLRKRIPVVSAEFDANDHIVPAGEEVCVISGDAPAFVRLKPASQLFTGHAVLPDFSAGPTPEYEPFFMIIELTASNYCHICGAEDDREFDRVYRQLRKNPDAKSPNPLLSYVQAAARLYMSLRPTSRAEYEAVMSRLARADLRHGSEEHELLRLRDRPAFRGEASGALSGVKDLGAPHERQAPRLLGKS